MPTPYKIEIRPEGRPDKYNPEHIWIHVELSDPHDPDAETFVGTTAGAGIIARLYVLTMRAISDEAKQHRCRSAADPDEGCQVSACGFDDLASPCLCYAVPVRAKKAWLQRITEALDLIGKQNADPLGYPWGSA